MESHTHDIPETHWVADICAGDHPTFSYVYALHFERLVKVAVTYGLCRDEAREIVQTVFLKLWESPPQMSNPRALVTYLHRVVINQSINYLRRCKMIQRHHVQIAAEESDVEEPLVNEPADVVVLHQLYSAIEELPTQCKRIFKMHRFENRTYREVAAIVGVAEKTVENHVMHALKQLRTKLRTAYMDEQH